MSARGTPNRPGPSRYHRPPSYEAVTEREDTTPANESANGSTLYLLASKNDDVSHRPSVQSFPLLARSTSRSPLNTIPEQDDLSMSSSRSCQHDVPNDSDAVQSLLDEALDSLYYK